MSGIEVVEESKYTGKFNVGDKVKVIGLTNERTHLSGVIANEYIVNLIDKEDKTLPYFLSAGGLESYWFNEAELELVENSEENNRPASSHYHIDNNGNDVWQFADDNLSDERVKGFHQINAIKYVARYEKKHDTAEKRIEDLKKAKVSIDKLIELEGME